MICAILLAAGRSERMGTQKLLLPFGPQQTVIGHVADQLLASPIDRVFAVVGPADAANIERALGDPVPDDRLTVVTNPDPANDMLSSVRFGLRSLPQECDAALVALGDQPSITSALVRQMLDAFRQAGRGIVVPLYAGKRGHPIVFSTCYRDEVLASYDDVGLRGLLAAHPQDVFELNVASSSVLSDMDYPEDYRRELDAMQRGRAGN